MSRVKRTLAETVEQARRKTIEQRLLEHDGNRTHTATSLGICRQQLQNLMKKYEINIPPQVRYRTGRWSTRA